MSSLHCTDHSTYNETCLRCMKTQSKLATKLEDLFPFQYPRTEAEYEQYINLAGGRERLTELVREYCARVEKEDRENGTYEEWRVKD
ncbi:MAG: hypothetical protein JSS09_00630 [Verrucomicrobia bacterium]|nr:hypothetical protein [Verrucomicrobiota bacterium]